MNICEACGRRAYWKIGDAAVCEPHTSNADVIALVSLRDPSTGRVYSPGSTVPAALVSTIVPVSEMNG